MSIIYSVSSGLNNAQIGKIETPLKMIIEHESDAMTKKGGPCDWLFNVEKSNKFGETIVGHNEFEVFQAAAEGAGAENDTMQETYKKFIEHIQFMKEFTITAQMMEDANYGVAADAQRRAENFVRAYYKTRNKICEAALVNAGKASTEFAKARLDLTTGDGLPLFHDSHKYGAKKGTQSNNFYLQTSSALTRETAAGAVEELLAELAVKLRNVKDENGEALGYTADTIILPGDNPLLEMATKKACGSDGTLGNGYNDINLQYGNWSIVVLPSWSVAGTTNPNQMMVMSSSANKNLAGNMFFNRIPLSVSSFVDQHTGNYIWTGRCRFGVGFGTYKHILKATISTSAVSGATKL